MDTRARVIAHPAAQWSANSARLHTNKTAGLGVVVVATRPLTRLGLCELVSRDAFLWLEHETASLLDACRHVRSGRPGIAVIDVERSLVDRTAIADLVDAGRRVVVLAAHEGTAEDLVDSGVSGVLGADRSPSQIVIALHAVVNGATVVAARSQTSRRREHDDVDLRLTNREVEVLEELITGKTNQEIGRLLGITVATVKFHVRNLMEKFDAGRRTELAYLAGRRFCRG